MSWFKKVENKNKRVEVLDKVEELKEIIENMKKESSEREDEFKEEIEKLHRIIKFASDEPTFRFERKYQHGWWSSSISNILSIYIEKEEYIFDLPELVSTDDVDENSYEFRVEKDLAYFNVSTYSIYTNWTKREYIIDFKKGSYVCNTYADEERNAKEKEKEDSGRPVE